VSTLLDVACLVHQKMVAGSHTVVRQLVGCSAPLRLRIDSRSGGAKT
jgi:hypothetical protein